jgi:predicted metal-dependent hydrolase
MRFSISSSTSVITERSRIEVGGISVEVVRKNIRNLHLAVYPPDGRVRIAVPLRLDAAAVRLAVIVRLRWIRRQRADFARQDRQSQRQMVSGESHYVGGRRFKLRVVEHRGPPAVYVRSGRTLELRVRPDTDRNSREGVLYRWYRRLLRPQIAALVTRWEPLVDVTLASWGIKRMKTRWGTCNGAERRIWLNLELAKKPPSCLEYILVHEMVHVLERYHNDRFRDFMDRLLPQWRHYRDLLNRSPLAHEDWGY